MRAKCSIRPARSMQGFSLLEALVTLVIIALVVALLMQGLLQVLAMRARLADHDTRVTAALLHERWFRDSVGAAVADLPRGLAPFLGERDSARMLSASPLLDDGLVPVEWRIERGVGGFALVYAQGERELPVLSDGLVDARFDYLDAEGEWHEQWPLDADTDDPTSSAAASTTANADALPRAMRLRAETRDGQRLEWWAGIAADPRLSPLLRQAEEVPSAGTL